MISIVYSRSDRVRLGQQNHALQAVMVGTDRGNMQRTCRTSCFCTAIQTKTIGNTRQGLNNIKKKLPSARVPNPEGRVCRSILNDGCAVWHVLDLAKHKFSSPGAIDGLREVWYSFLWRQDVATPGSAALHKMWRSRVSLMQ
jgi:hypothetical protein